MSMTLRLTDEQTQALREQAETEHRSMQSVALTAIDSYVQRERHRAVVDRAIESVAERHAELNKRLAST